MFEGSRARRAVRNLLWNTCLAQKFGTVRPERRPALRGVINPRAASGAKTNVARYDGDGRMGACDGTHRRRPRRPRARASSREMRCTPSSLNERADGGAGGVARGWRTGRRCGRRGTRARRARRRACRPRLSTEWSRPSVGGTNRHTRRTPAATVGWRPLNRVVDSLVTIRTRRVDAPTSAPRRARASSPRGAAHARERNEPPTQRTPSTAATARHQRQGPQAQGVVRGGRRRRGVLRHGLPPRGAEADDDDGGALLGADAVLRRETERGAIAGDARTRCNLRRRVRARRRRAARRVPPPLLCRASRFGRPGARGRLDAGRRSTDGTTAVVGAEHEDGAGGGGGGGQRRRGRKDAASDGSIGPPPTGERMPASRRGRWRST